MRIKIQPYLFVCFFILAGCGVHNSYFMSPLDINANSYHNIPLHADSVKLASYCRLVFSNGRANDESDNVFSGQASIHQSKNFGHFQAYYGLGISIGAYRIEDFNIQISKPVDSYVDTQKIVIQTPSSKFFGAYGANGGINYVIPFRKGEWRVFGIETSLNNEFGSYLKLRKSIPDSQASVLAKSNWTNTIGVYSEIIHINRRKGGSFGYKLSAGLSLFPKITAYENEMKVPFYVSNTLHLTKEKKTIFWQVNVGPHAMGLQIGLNYKIGNR